ncbi:MAG: hypothetical protein ACYTF0_01880 [Planctomycetota bacterium]|jgi:hypothetical protein
MSIGHLPLKYTYDETHNILLCHPTGIVTADSIIAYLNEVIASGMIRQDTIEYVDMSHIDDLAFSYADAQRLADAQRALAQAGSLVSVFHADMPSHYGIVRMISAIVSSALPANDLPPRTLIPSREPIAPADLRSYCSRHMDGPPP